MYDITTLQNFFEKIFCKKIYRTHKYIIAHMCAYCNVFFKKSVDNFLFLKNFL